MTNSIPEKIKYKFTLDPKTVEKVKKFVYDTNFKANSIEIKDEVGKNTISFIPDSEKELFKLHNFLLKVHKITGNRKKKKIKEPKIAIMLKGKTNYKFFFNYLLGEDFCKILKENNIKFSVPKIIKNGFHYLDTCPIWITEKDLDNVKRIIKESIYGKTFRVTIINFNILEE